MTYTASISQSGRQGWAVIFRHPARLDEENRPGRRVRRGLGTRDLVEAEKLKGQVNELLADRAYWQPSAEPAAALRFDPRVVRLFFETMTAESVSPRSTRDDLLPLPAADSEYRQVLLVGPTGAGKTTLLRQLLGTHPTKERFPATSTGRCTVADTEIVLTDSDEYRAVVTFFGRDEIRDTVEECCSAVVLAALHDATDRDLARRLLRHPDQRFRFHWLLGEPAVDDTEIEDQDEDEESADDTDEESGGVNGAAAAHARDFVDRSLARLRHVASTAWEAVAATVGAGTGQEHAQIVRQLLDEAIDAQLHEHEQFQEVVDEYLDEIEARIAAMNLGSFQRNRQGWPVSWTIALTDRAEFLRALATFTSNSAPRFGALLTPLVNGVRVAGPFGPQWAATRPRLVLVDGEGLGHTQESSVAVSTSLMRRFDEANVVVVVDNAQAPMQAAVVGAVRALITSGNQQKTVFALTHFDLVTGANLPTAADKREHVLGSTEGVLKALATDFSPETAHAVRRRIEVASVCVGSMHKVLDDRKHAGTIARLRALLDIIDTTVVRTPSGTAEPVYLMSNLLFAIQGAAMTFHDLWDVRLGFVTRAGLDKEHWTRIKALSRRYATGMSKEYDRLKPIAELEQTLRDAISRTLENPATWAGDEPDDETKQACFDALKAQTTGNLRALADQRLYGDRLDQWQQAFRLSGTGSTFDRARLLNDSIYAKAAPIPSAESNPDANQFVIDVIRAVREAVEEQGATLR